MLRKRATTANAAIDPAATDDWWEQRGGIRHEVHGGWTARSVIELEAILRIEFPAQVVEDFIAQHDSPLLSYRFAVYQWTKPVGG